MFEQKRKEAKKSIDQGKLDRVRQHIIKSTLMKFVHTWEGKWRREWQGGGKALPGLSQSFIQRQKKKKRFDEKVLHGIDKKLFSDFELCSNRIRVLSWWKSQSRTVPFPGPGHVTSRQNLFGFFKERLRDGWRGGGRREKRDANINAIRWIGVGFCNGVHEIRSIISLAKLNTPRCYK